MSVLIKGGRVVTAADSTVADVFIEGERISLIGASLDVDADRVIDATGKLVLPGAIDPHTHLDMPFGGTVTIDDVTSGQTAAAFGGTTCHVDFCIQGQGQTFAERARGLAREARGQGDHRQRLPHRRHRPDRRRHARGARDAAGAGRSPPTSCFMAYKGALMVDDETLFRAMQLAAETGALVMVHAENGDAIDVLVQARRSRPGTPRRATTR